MIPHIVPILQHLFQNGVSEDDKISRNDLVTKIAKNSFPLDIQDNNNDNAISKATKDNSLISNNNKNNNNNDRTKYWRSFIDQLE